MAWRVVEHGARRWNVSSPRERRAHSAEWNLVFSFRSAERRAAQRLMGDATRSRSASKAALFAQAEKPPSTSLAARSPNALCSVRVDGVA